MQVIDLGMTLLPINYLYPDCHRGVTTDRVSETSHADHWRSVHSHQQEENTHDLGGNQESDPGSEGGTWT